MILNKGSVVKGDGSIRGLIGHRLQASRELFAGYFVRDPGGEDASEST